MVNVNYPVLTDLPTQYPLDSQIDADGSSPLHFFSILFGHINVFHTASQASAHFGSVALSKFPVEIAQ